MKCTVLTEGHWEKLLRDELAAEESAAIHAHLEGDCPDCEAFLLDMSMETEQALSETRSDLLARERRDASRLVKRIMTPAAPAVFGTAGMADAGAGRVAGVTASRHHLPAWFGGIAALLLITVGIFPQLQSGVTDMEMTGGFEKTKGPAVANRDFRLDFSTGQLRDGRLVIERGRPGDKYNSDSLLFFQYEASAGGYLYLIAVGDHAAATLLYPVAAPAKPMPSGENSVATSGKIASFPLAGLHGRYTVVGVFSPRPLDSQRQALVAAVRKSLNVATGAVDAGSLTTFGGGIEVDAIQFDVGT